MCVLVVVGFYRVGNTCINGRASWNVLTPVGIAGIDSHPTKVQVSVTEDKSREPKVLTDDGVAFQQQ